MAEANPSSRSYLAMFLSAILPGLGQLYLAQFLKGTVILVVFASAIGIFYVNSLPVTEWRDLMRFQRHGETAEDGTGSSETKPDYAIHLWTFDNGEKLMYQPSWKLKISALIQAGLCWLYAVGDGWRGRRRFSPASIRSHQKKALILFFLCSWLVFTLFVLGCQDKAEVLKRSEELLRMGMPREAADELEKAMHAFPENSKARWGKYHLLLGQAYDELGRYQDAIEQFRKASQFSAAQPEQRIAARLHLAHVYLKFGDRDSAFRVLRLIQRSSSDAEVFRKIAELVGDTYKTKQLTHGDSDNYSPTFSPDGTQLAFASFRLDNGEIYLMDLDGRIRQRVTFTTDFNDSSPAFLTTPYHLFYSSEPKSSREVKVVIQSSGSTPIYAGFNLTHIHSKTTRAVLPVSFGARVPRTSPAGNQVVYESNADGNLELYLLDLAGLNLAQISPEQIKPKRITYNETDDGSPTFFPDGQRLVFVSSRNEVNQLYTIDIDGKNEKHFNANRYDCYNPTVSPDGKTIAYVSARDGDMEIYLIDANGQNERRITGDIGVSIQPAFSPDGQHLAYVSDRSDTFHIYLMDFDEPVTREELVKRLQR